MLIFGDCMSQKKPVEEEFSQNLEFHGCSEGRNFATAGTSTPHFSIVNPSLGGGFKRLLFSPYLGK